MIRSWDGEAVRISAQNWMIALGKAVLFLGIRLDDAELSCSPQDDRVMRVTERGTERYWSIEMHTSKLRIMALDTDGQSLGARTETETTQHADMVPFIPTPRANLGTPDLPPEGGRGDEASGSPLAERLFELTFDIAEADAAEACRLALALIRDYVGAEAGSILRGTLNDDALTFVAADGPVGSKLIGRTVPFGSGLSGYAFDMGATLVANDARKERHHFERIDEETGFETRVALCVPIQSSELGSLGVIQLLNPTSGVFSDLHIEVVETVARTLVGTFSR